MEKSTPSTAYIFTPSDLMITDISVPPFTAHYDVYDPQLPPSTAPGQRLSAAGITADRDLPHLPRRGFVAMFHLIWNAHPESLKSVRDRTRFWNEKEGGSCGCPQ